MPQKVVIVQECVTYVEQRKNYLMDFINFTCIRVCNVDLDFSVYNDSVV